MLDYRAQALGDLKNVEVYRQNPVTAEDVVEYGFEHVAVAAGATWRRDGVARWHTTPMQVDAGTEILTPDDLMAGVRPGGKRVVLFDDDHYYMGGVLAELLAREGHEVHLVTPAAQVSSWTFHTLEVVKVNRRVLEAGVTVHCNQAVTAVRSGHVTVANAYTGQESELAADSVVLVTSRLPEESLLLSLAGTTQENGITVRGIGDAWAPGTIAAAVWSGRRYAEELDAGLPSNDNVPFRREVTELTLLPLIPS